MRTILALVSALIGALCFADGVVYTGCLQREKGILYFVREGTSPMRLCDEGDRVISFNQMGTPGPPGPAGPAGPQGPPGPAAQGPRLFRFVGVTSARFNGAGGWINMTRACAVQYPGSRMATSEEFRLTPNPPDVPEPAWILLSPGVISLELTKILDRTGSTIESGPSRGYYDCYSWSNADPIIYGTVGTILGVNGAIQREACDQIRAVACSAPEP